MSVPRASACFGCHLAIYLYANIYRLPPLCAEDSRGSSGIGTGKSIGLAEGILLPVEAIDSNRSRPKECVDLNGEQDFT